MYESAQQEVFMVELEMVRRWETSHGITCSCKMDAGEDVKEGRVRKRRAKPEALWGKRSSGWTSPILSELRFQGQLRLVSSSFSWIHNTQTHCIWVFTCFSPVCVCPQHRNGCTMAWIATSSSSIWRGSPTLWSSSPSLPGSRKFLPHRL